MGVATLQITPAQHEAAPEAPPQQRKVAERLSTPLSPAARAGLLTVGIAAATGLSVLTGFAMGMSARHAVVFAIPLGVAVGFLMALLLILIPSRQSNRHLHELAQRIARVAKVDRESHFEDLLRLDDDHELRNIAVAVHDALKTAHADRLEAARLRRDMEARVEKQTRANTAQLNKLSQTDELTGLVNRRGFEQLLDDMFLDAVSGGPELALLAIDLDHFKKLNDTCGHDKGDLALVVAGELMKAGTRTGDAAARVGGDELFLLLRGANAEQAANAGSRLADLFSRHPSSKGLPWPTMSMGIALAQGSAARSPQHLRQLADVALYGSKRSGRAKCVVYDPKLNPAEAAA